MAKSKKTKAAEIDRPTTIALQNTAMRLLREHLIETGSGMAKVAVVDSLIEPGVDPINVSSGNRAPDEVRVILSAIKSAAGALRARGFEGTAVKAEDFAGMLALTIASDGQMAGDPGDTEGDAGDEETESGDPAGDEPGESDAGEPGGSEGEGDPEAGEGDDGETAGG